MQEVAYLLHIQNSFWCLHLSKWSRRLLCWCQSASPSAVVATWSHIIVAVKSCLSCGGQRGFGALFKSSLRQVFFVSLFPKRYVNVPGELVDVGFSRQWQGGLSVCYRDLMNLGLVQSGLGSVRGTIRAGEPLWFSHISWTTRGTCALGGKGRWGPLICSRNVQNL